MARYRESLDRDPAGSLTRAYLSWKPKLLYPSDPEAAELDRAANRIVTDYLSRAASGSALLWRPLWYRRPKDAWCDDAFWVSTAQARLEWRGRDMDALTLLLRFGYRGRNVDLAARILDPWLAAGGQDYEIYLDLIAAAFPDHEPSRKYLDPDGYGWREFSEAVAATNHEPLLREAGKAIEEWDQPETMLASLGAERAVRYVTEAALMRIRAELRDACAVTLRSSGRTHAEETELYFRHSRAATCAAVMGWDDILRTLGRNPEYLHQLFFGLSDTFEQWAGEPRGGAEFLYQGAFADWTADLLAWSWALPVDRFTGLVAAEGLRLSKPGRARYINEQQRLLPSLAAAIAWTRHRHAINATPD